MVVPNEVVLPRTVDRARVLAACEALGINPAGIRKVEMGQGYVDVQVRMVIDGWRTDDPVPGGDVEAEYKAVKINPEHAEFDQSARYIA
jgi:hypothetical protein